MSDVKLVERPMRGIVLVGFSCLALGACVQQQPDPRGVARDEVLVQVMATGRADARPDEARFTAGVQTLGASASAASAANNEAMNRVTEALEKLGVKPDDLQTRQITLQRIDYGRDRGRFQANNMVEVRVRDMNLASRAIAAATDNGANVLSGPNMVLSDPEAARRSAYAQAYKAARSRADAYAEAAGLKVGRVLAIRDFAQEGGRDGYYPPAIGVEAMAQTAAPPLRPGLTTSEVNVRVDFALVDG